jgi:hypothetical protein
MRCRVHAVVEQPDLAFLKLDEECGCSAEMLDATSGMSTPKAFPG